MSPRRVYLPAGRDETDGLATIYFWYRRRDGAAQVVRCASEHDIRALHRPATWRGLFVTC